MRQPIIQLSARRSHAENPGLLLQRFLTADATGANGDPAERHALLAATIQATRAEGLRSLYRQAFDQWTRSFPDDPLNPFVDLRTTGRLIVGLGSESVLETGIRLHSTYGLPVIPGSGFKGLAAHYSDHVWGQRHLADDAKGENKAFRREGPDDEHQFHKLLFGTTADGGVIAFHDAWILPECLGNSGLELDVMTPHHPRWQTNAAAPTDFDSPIPVAFLSVCGTFRVRLSWAGPVGHSQSGAWTTLAMSLLKEALAEWGVGGKTSSGYGRLVEKTGPEQDVRQPAPALARRATGTPTRVRIIAERKKGGFDVQEPNRAQGTLTLGSPPTGANPSIGNDVDVQVHVDDPKTPQYKWPAPPTPARNPGKRPHGRT